MLLAPSALCERETFPYLAFYSPTLLDLDLEVGNFWHSLIGRRLAGADLVISKQNPNSEECRWSGTFLAELLVKRKEILVYFLSFHVWHGRNGVIPLPNCVSALLVMAGRFVWGGN